jgi:hypothetical protein
VTSLQKTPAASPRAYGCFGSNRALGAVGQTCPGCRLRHVRAQVCVSAFDNAHTPNPPQSKRPSSTRARHITYQLFVAPAVKSVHSDTEMEKSVRTCISISPTSAHAHPATIKAQVQNTHTRDTPLTNCVKHQPPRASTVPPESKERVRICVSISTTRTCPIRHNKLPSNTHARIHITYKLRETPAAKSVHSATGNERIARAHVLAFRQHAHAHPSQSTRLPTCETNYLPAM